MKLKTLKDLQEDPSNMRHCNWVVSSLDLKQEAIKWVKKFTKQGIHQWEMKLFKEFHNITKEDLKEKERRIESPDYPESKEEWEECGWDIDKEEQKLKSEDKEDEIKK